MGQENEHEKQLHDMYLSFRKTMDDYCFPLLKEWAERQHGFIPLYDDETEEQKDCGKTCKSSKTPVGFLIVIDGYVDGIYVIPEYRRKGIARKAVMDYLGNGCVIERLHIIRSNKPALHFWKSIFILEPENDCPVDVLYHVIGLKNYHEKE